MEIPPQFDEEYQEAKATSDHWETFLSVEDFEKSISLWETLLSREGIKDNNDFYTYIVIENIKMHLNKHQEFGCCPKDIDQTIALCHTAINQLRDGSPYLPYLHHLIGAAFKQRYLFTSDIAALDKAIENWNIAIGKTKEDSELAKFFHNLGDSLICRFEIKGSELDLEKAIETMQEGLNYVTEDRVFTAKRFNSLGDGFKHRYDLNGYIIDLERSINAFKDSLDLIANIDTRIRPGILNNLSAGYLALYKYIGNILYLNKSEYFCNKAIDDINETSILYPIILNNKGCIFRERYLLDGEIISLEKAFWAWSKTLNCANLIKTHLPSILNNLAIALSDLNEYTGNMYYLQQAISLWRRSIDLSNTDSHNISSCISSMIDGLRNAYRQTGSQSYLNEAIKLSESMAITPGKGQNFAEIQNNLGNALKDIFELTGNLSDLEGSLEAYESSVENTPDESPNLPTRLSNLGGIYRIKYLYTNDPNYLEKSINLLNKSLSILHNANNSRLQKVNNNLGNSLHQKFLLTRNVEDLIRAKSLIQSAVDTTQEGNIDLPIYLISLSNVLDDLHLINDAIGSLKRALVLTPRNSPETPLILNTLGVVYSDRYLISNGLNVIDLKNAIAYWNDALELLERNSPHLPIILNNLALALRHNVFDTSFYLDALDSAIEKLYYAAELTPTDSFYFPIILNNLANLLLMRYDNKKAVFDLENALNAFVDAQYAFDNSFALSPIDQKIGIRNTWEFIDGQLIETAIRLMDVSVAEKKEFYAKLALTAAEGSKSRLLTEFVGRRDLAIPNSIHRPIFLKEKELLKKLVKIDTKELAIIGKPTKIDAGPDYKMALLEERRKLMEELQGVWQEIEKLSIEGAKFVALRRGDKPSWEDISGFSRKAGKETTIICLYLFNDVIYFFTLMDGELNPMIIKLPFKKELQNDWIDNVLDEVRNRKTEKWTEVFMPFFKSLFTYLSTAKRIVISPYGITHLLPWSALGYKAGLSARWVSTPSLGCLIRVMQLPPTAIGNSILIVGDPKGDLASSREEAEYLGKMLNVEPLIGPEATLQAVLGRLEKVDLAHFAAHAFFCRDNPLDSGIKLANGNITEQDIVYLDLKSSLITISACESGKVGILGGDELAGLSQAFFIAGARSLIVSHWTVSDEATKQLMIKFYDEWINNKVDKAEALNIAMNEIRKESKWGYTYYWGAFSIIGDWR